MNNQQLINQKLIERHYGWNSLVQKVLSFVCLLGLLFVHLTNPATIYGRGRQELPAPSIGVKAIPGTYQVRVANTQLGEGVLTLELGLDNRVRFTEDFGGDRVYLQEGFWSFDGRELVTRILTKEGTEPPRPLEPRPPRILRWQARGAKTLIDLNDWDSQEIADPFIPLELQISGQELDNLPHRTLILEKIQGPQVTGVVWEWIRTVTPKETFQPKEPENHTLYIDSNGALGLQLGCNRGGGEYTMIPRNRSHPVTGSLELGNIFSTMMYCPDQETANRFSRELQYVRVFFLKDQLLHLDLFADGGTMVFRPRIAGRAEGDR